MKNKIYNKLTQFLTLALLLLLILSCSKDFEDLELATFPNNPEVFIDDFSSGLNYAVFAGANLTAFSVDTEIKYKGTKSMKFAVPDAGEPNGSYAGGVFYTEVGRDLSEYDALTFWARASQPASIDLIGFGNDLEESRYQSSLSGLQLNTNWKKFYIPIADASKLVEERGMLFFSEAPENGKGYTFWLDEVQFEKLGTIAHPKAFILEMQDQVIAAESGDNLVIGGLYGTFNLPTGVDQRVNLAPSFYTFTSSNPSVAVVNTLGVATVLDQGTATITAKLGELDAKGSLTIESTGEAVRPPVSAPLPTISADSVISMFSNVYPNITVDTWNPFWEFSTAEVTDIKIGEDDVKRYNNLNFVGILTEAQPINASNMTHFHMDIWTPLPTDLPTSFKVLLVDFGADGSFGGGDDSSHELAFTSPTLQTGSWVSLDIPLSDFTGLRNRTKIAQLVLSGELSTVFIDNVYYYNSGVIEEIDMPDGPAPVPARNADDVISIYSDNYNNVEGTNFNPDWGQATAVSEVEIEGNKTLLYAGLNYQGTEFNGSLDVSSMTHIHIDYWTANSNLLNFYLISPGPVEKPVSLGVPTSGWNSIDIPLADFSPVDLANLIQFKVDGNGDIYFDNIYFYKGDSGGGDPVPPSGPAPAPTLDAEQVISIYSDAYSNVPNVGFNLYGTADFEEVSIQGDNALKYTGTPATNFQVIELGGDNQIDATGSGMTHLHFDLWFPNAIEETSSFLLKLVDIPSSGASEALIFVNPSSDPALEQGKWIQFDLPFTELSTLGLGGSSNIQQLVIDLMNTGEVYMDNIYLYKDGGTGEGPQLPTAPAPAPVQEASNVVSIYSDAYSNVANEGFNLYGNADFEEVFLQGDGALRYTGTPATNFQVIELGGANQIDAANLGMTHMHFDLWFPNAVEETTSFLMKLVDIPASGASEALIFIGPNSDPAMEQGKWIQFDLPFTELTTLGLAGSSNIQQLVIDLMNTGDVFIDNIYFYKDGGTGGGPLLPTIPAPDPIQEESNVASIYSDAFNNVPNEGFNLYGTADFEEVFIQGNGALKYTGTPATNFQVIELGGANQIDAASLGLTHLHFDLWFPNEVEETSSFLMKLVDIPASGASEALIFVNPASDPALEQGKWIQFDIPFTELQALGLGGNSNIQQVVIDLMNTGEVYIDNIYMYK